MIDVPKADWIIAMVLQVKLCPKENHLDTSDSFFPVSRAKSRLVIPFSCKIWYIFSEILKFRSKDARSKGVMESCAS